MIRVLIADDQALVRGGFRMILESRDDVEVVGEAADGAEAVAGRRSCCWAWPTACSKRACWTSRCSTPRSRATTSRR